MDPPTPTLSGYTICGNGVNFEVRGDRELPGLTGNEICEDTAAK